MVNCVEDMPAIFSRHRRSRKNYSVERLAAGTDGLANTAPITRGQNTISNTDNGNKYIEEQARWRKTLEVFREEDL